MSEADVIIDKAWSSIQPPDFVRWATPSFIKYGHVLKHKKGDHGLTLQLIDEDRIRVIPEAYWYYGQFKIFGPNTENHLCVIDYSAWYNGPKQVWEPENSPNEHEWITVQQAAELLKFDQKDIRRKIRRGHIEAEMVEGRWRINAELLRDRAAKFGWA